MFQNVTSSRFHQRGVTLAELMAVVVVVGLIASAAIVNSATSDVARVEAARSMLARAIRHARDESIRTRVPYGVRVDQPQSRVRVFRVDTSVSPPGQVFDVRDPLSKQSWDHSTGDDDALVGVSVDLSLTWRAACSQTGIIVFRDGATPSCLDPLSTLLESGVATASRGGHQAEVFVEGFVARVDLR